jgi:hypothetical protein
VYASEAAPNLLAPPSHIRHIAVQQPLQMRFIGAVR